jgi:hypothetical protein
MFMEMVFLIFHFDSSSLFSFLFLTSLDENELSRGVNPFGIFLSSRHINSLFKGSFCKNAHILSSLEKTYQDSTLSGK